MDRSEFPAGGLGGLLEPGSPHPLGATLEERGTNFAVYSRHATRMTLALFSAGDPRPSELALPREAHRTGDVWHVFVPGVRAGTEYGWHADSNARGPEHAFDADALLLDPYAKGIAGSERWGERSARPLRGVVCDLRYDWGDDRRPGTPLTASVIYELHVRSFTRHPSSGVDHPGTFAGLIDKIPYLASLGVTAVQLLPVAEFDETDNRRTDPRTGERLWNAWGYAPLAFMAPRTAYAADATAAGALRGFRDLVRALHVAGIEVILDVVYNHTGEGTRRAPPRSWRGLDRAAYFLLDERGRDLDHTGCGHTFACGHPAAADLILDALRFWAVEMRVDGFRFDLASTLTRGERGEPLADPPLIRRIATDPALAHCKLIAEPWDTGLYQVGSFPHHGRFAELNGRFRDDVRDWLRRASPGPEALATRLIGSPDLYGPERGPGASVNFITCHDGFTLADLVSYERKHNAANGEHGHDGGNDPRSWNCGVEGPAASPAIHAVRMQQVRNAAALGLLAHGARFWLWGDELLRSQDGNNNPWCQDGPDWWLDWSEAAGAVDFARFVRGLLTLRREHPLLRGERGFAPDGPDRVAWQSETLGLPQHESWTGRRLGMHLIGPQAPEFLLLVNGEGDVVSFQLPSPAYGHAWRLVVDTAAPPPGDFTPLGKASVLRESRTRPLPGHSLVLLATR